MHTIQQLLNAIREIVYTNVEPKLLILKKVFILFF